LAGPFRLLCYDNYTSHPTRTYHLYLQRTKAIPALARTTTHKILSPIETLKRQTASPSFTPPFHFPSPSPYSIYVLRHQRPFINTCHLIHQYLACFDTIVERINHARFIYHPCDIRNLLRLALIRSCLRLLDFPTTYI
jgi:hypothetical protein